jgi:hypothetical protein
MYLVVKKVLVLGCGEIWCGKKSQILQTKVLPPSSERIKKSVPEEHFRCLILHGVTSHKSVILVFILISSNCDHLQRRLNKINARVFNVFFKRNYYELWLSKICNLYYLFCLVADTEGGAQAEGV